MGSNQPEIPQLCERGCGFFGNPMTRNLCSVCYKMLLKEEAWILASETSARVSQEDHHHSTVVDDENNIDINDAAKKTKKNRCESCNKRVGLIGFGCRCGGTFCRLHRLPEEHACKIDYKSAGRVVLEKENQICVADKLEDRV